MNNKQLFSGKAEHYFSARPSYPDALIEWLRQRTGSGTVVDIGAGTGIFTSSLLKKFSDVIAIEPNEDMRSKFLQYLPGVPCVAGCAEATGLDDSSAVLVTCAQAFHWFDEDKFKSECIRILSPSGRVAVIWNNPVKSDFSAERDEVCRELCPRFSRGYAGKRSAEEGDKFLREQYLKNPEVESFIHSFVMDKECFCANMSSRSYAPIRGSMAYRDFMERLQTLFDRHAVDGKVTEILSAQIYLGTLE